ncbi:tetratricopeptide repeat protein [Streptomyces sp. NPDC005492]|uniref:tetratricopeptide repeat protein n=1 Tax=Streptomyces sp. NPDC005492 TaxID=3156883 RepID=UPI0033A38E75
MDLITAGGRNPDYVARVQSIDWDHLYSDADFGNILEEWRQIWINSYDIILVDSRTGISDSGGICTSQLPHVLAYAFTANQQNLDGVLDVVTRAAKARNRLPYDRSRLLTLPLLCRFDMSEEYERAAEWREKLNAELRSSYSAWVPESSDTDRVIDNCTVPYSAYWSFGEELPVVSEDIRNPRLISYSIASIAALLARKMEDVALFTESRDAYVDSAIRAGRRGGEYRHEVFISSAPNMMREAKNLSRLLTTEGISTFFRGEETPPGYSNARGKLMRSAIDTSQHLVFLVRDGMKSAQREDLNYFIRQTLDEQSDRKVFPVVASRDALLSLPSIVKGVTAYSLSDSSLANIARMIKVEISGDRSFSNSAAHHQLGIAAQNQGDLAAAERHFRNALAIDEQLNDRFGVATSHRQLGIVAQLQGRLEEAEDWYRQSLTIEEELGDRPGIAISYHQLGLIAQGRGDLDDAENWYRQSLTINEELGDRSGMARSHRQLGLIAQLRGRLEEAEDWYRQSLTVNEELGNRPGTAISYHQLGLIAQGRGHLDDAENWYRQSLTINEELGDRPGTAISYHQLGLIAQGRGDLDDAENWYRQSLTINEELGDRSGMARSYRQLGLIAQLRGRLEEAEDWYRQSLTIEEELGNRSGTYNSYGQLGVLRTEQQRPADGVPYTLRALAIALEIGRPPDASLYWLGRQRTLLGVDTFRSILDDLLPNDEALSVMNATQPQDEPASDDDSTGSSNPTSTDQA